MKSFEAYRSGDLERSCREELGRGASTNQREMRVYSFESVTSTMDVAREVAEGRTALGAPTTETVIAFVARMQTAGRGREGRQWYTGAGTLAVTYLLPVSRLAGSLPLAMGVGVVRTAREFGRRAQLKWPNDVVAGELGAWRKVGGILCESIQGGAGTHVLVGIGMNVEPDSYPPDVPGISLSELPDDSRAPGTRRELSRDGVFSVLSSEVIGLGDIMERDGFQAIRDEYLASSVLPGTTCTVRCGTERISGEVTTVNVDGALEIRTTTGTRVIYSGTIEAVSGTGSARVDV